MTSRLPPRPGEVLDRAHPIEFTWNGEPCSGYRGDTIASALAACGVSVFGRSFKYHRPRGILTADFLDPNLFVQVGDEPNVRAGHRLIASGMHVSAQNVWPSLKFDAKAINGVVARFLTPGFYYKTFMRPRRLWPFYQRVLRRFAAGGRLDANRSSERYDHRYAHPDVVVAGGGPAGMAAALSAADAGAAVMLVEEAHELGGHLRWGDTADLEALAASKARVEAAAGIEVLTDSVVTGRYDHNWLAILQRNPPGAIQRIIKARAKVLVVAAGTVERPFVFEGNDLPGVMLSGAVRRLVNLYAVEPGTRAVVFTANASGDAAASDLETVGIHVTRVDARRGEGILRATGRQRVNGVILTDGSKLAADLVVTATGWTTPTSLLNMAGCRPVYSPRAARFLPGPLPDDVMTAGGIEGDGTTDQLIAHGAAVGAEAARRALQTRSRWRAATPAARTTDVGIEPARPVDPLPAADHPELYTSGTNGFVDFSEDVTAKDLIMATAEGYDSIELSKRYTTATMGPVQGKLEMANAVAIHAQATGRPIAETGTTTWRPPYAPITLAALAGHHSSDAIRRSPMHDWHAEHGAAPLIAGQWIRPEHYGDSNAEVMNVRSKVGIIDVSPLGKIDLRGPDVPVLLDFVYTNKWLKLPVGRVRYGVMCTEDGVVFDDGVVGRLADDRWLMTTTSGGAGAVWNWLEDWIQARGWDVSMTAVTDGYASINVAGPLSRELMARVTQVDVEGNAFPYMHVRTGTVAGVEGCVVWRIGFTGELSYEIHVPAGFGLWVWESLLELGSGLGVAPFGVEAQRIMRLEKGHFIVGQDTDGLTQAFTAGVDWAIKLDKTDFAGKPELAWQAQRGDHPRLVAIQPEDPRIVPAEASQILDGGTIIGRVTSSRWSPTLRRSIGLAQVASGHAEPGAVLTVRLPDGRDAPVTVMNHHAHFDPEGTRLRG